MDRIQFLWFLNIWNYVKKYIAYIPFMNKNINSLTDKFSLKTYIFLNKRYISDLSTTLSK